jgi:hypothetical protein
VDDPGMRGFGGGATIIGIVGGGGAAATAAAGGGGGMDPGSIGKGTPDCGDNGAPGIFGWGTGGADGKGKFFSAVVASRRRTVSRKRTLIPRSQARRLWDTHLRRQHDARGQGQGLSLIHISEPTRLM